ncbi:hypothetical protein GWI33_006472 [Rhynchophorus ferrugineus]|uniref:Mitochondrial carrier protein n=1 Tax=Rhynchophorus ferrugineus TaxID=354439 RepID=A0A834IIN7_RHYFE|nr:hypothetical protein GWI33_006472 [Rhynchophorus ferrugineus]
MNSGFLADFTAGWVGGVLCVVTGYPFDTIKVRQQNFSASLWTAFKETLRYEGIFGFYRGLVSPLIAYGPSNSIFFGFYGISMHALNGQGPGAPSHINDRCKYFLNLFCAGIMCPVELVKIGLQTNSRESQTIIKYHGLGGLYKGFLPMIFRDVPTSGIYFVVYEGLLPHSRKDIQWYHKIWAGGWAGIASISSVLPMDVIKTRIQADDPIYPRYNGFVDCTRKLYQEEGYRIFWKGLPVITMRAFPANAMMFVGYEMTMEFLGAK